ncbi:hypothetical protein [Pseudonocardia sp. NPDC049635]|uniref:hypothetical protein n=1 Tax=Pseudonocardia sp. NPDC049635 TaxID=3155506 RepID=UPI00340B0C80
MAIEISASSAWGGLAISSSTTVSTDGGAGSRQQPVAFGYMKQNCSSWLDPLGAVGARREESCPKGLSSIAAWTWLILTVAQMMTMRNVMEAMLVVT